MVRILCTGSGSGGHIFPLIAVWRAVQQKDPSAMGFFVCSDREEDGLYFKKENLPYFTLPSIRRNVFAPFAGLLSYRRAQRILEQTKPDVIFAKSGSVSVPLCYAAHQKKIPIVLHESDAVMGRTNRMISKWASVICLGLENPKSPAFARLGATAGKQIPNLNQSLVTSRQSLITTGNPIRPHITQGSREKGLQLTNFSGTRPILLIFGGSQGTQVFNEWIIKNITDLTKQVDVVHLTGRGKKGASPQPGYFSLEFASEELPHLYAIASLAITRAGNGNITELAANGIPAILIPIRGLAQDHQWHNAQVAAEGGGCIVVEQEDMEHILLSTTLNLVTDSKKLHDHSQKIRALACKKSAEDIADILLTEAKKSGL